MGAYDWRLASMYLLLMSNRPPSDDSDDLHRQHIINNTRDMTYEVNATVSIYRPGTTLSSALLLTLHAYDVVTYPIE